MVSLLSKSCWLNTRPQSPKVVEESVDSEDEFSSESAISYIYSEDSVNPIENEESSIEFSYIISAEDPKPNETKYNPLMKSSINLRSSIFTYKTNSAKKIQKLFRAKTAKKRFQFSAEKISSFLAKILKKKALFSIKTWTELIKAVLKIQRFWKRNLKNCKVLRSQLTYLVKIGSRLKKVNNFLDTFKGKLTSSCVSSPLLSKSFLRSQTNYLICPNLSTHDTQESNLNSPSISQFERSQLTSPKSEITKIGSLSLLKPSTKIIRIKRKSTLDLNELSKQLENDFKKFAPWREECGSKIPTLSRDSKFFLGLEKETKTYLLCEYSELLKQ